MSFAMSIRVRVAGAAAVFALTGTMPAAAHAQQADSELWEYVASGAGISGAALLDVAARDRFALDSSFASTPLGFTADRLGRPETWLAVTAVAFVAGRVSGSDELADGAWHSAVAMGAADVIQKGIKIAVGRARPGTAESPFVFEPGSTDWNHQAFPSGHTTVAFAMAAALREESGHDPVVTSAAFTGAAVVAWARIARREHWASDVVAGGILGTLVAQGVMRTLHSNDSAADQRAPSRLPPLVLTLRVPL